MTKGPIFGPIVGRTYRIKKRYDGFSDTRGQVGDEVLLTSYSNGVCGFLVPATYDKKDLCPQTHTLQEDQNFYDYYILVPKKRKKGEESARIKE